MTSMRKQAGVGLIGVAIGMILNISFSAPPLNALNPWLWLIPAIIGIVFYLKS